MVPWVPLATVSRPLGQQNTLKSPFRDLIEESPRVNLLVHNHKLHLINERLSRFEFSGLEKSAQPMVFCATCEISMENFVTHTLTWCFDRQTRLYTSLRCSFIFFRLLSSPRSTKVLGGLAHVAGSARTHQQHYL